MKVTMLSCTPNALDLLLTTKATRLDGKAVSDMTDEEKMTHWGYMRNTLKSSWEFVDYVFQIEGVTRAFTHQLVRNRTGSYAQQAQRAVDASKLGVVTPEALILEDGEGLARFLESADMVKAAYSGMIDVGVARQDARAILPTNIETSIMAKFNLRTLSEMAKVRLCTRSQVEIQSVFREMRRLILEAHQWTEGLFEVGCVATGECMFINYGPEGCKHYDPRMDNKAFKEELRIKYWAHESIQEAAPTATADGIAKEPSQLAREQESKQ